MGKKFYKSSNPANMTGSIIKDFTSVTVTPSTLARGFTAHDENANLIVGTNDELLANMKNTFARRDKKWDEPYYDEDGYFIFKSEYRDIQSNTAGAPSVYLPNITKITSPPAWIAQYNFSSVYLPNVTKLPDAIFEGCASLTFISVPKLSCVPSRAFLGCTNLDAVYLESASYIYNYAFYGCTKLKSVYLMSTSVVSFQGNFDSAFTSIPSTCKIYVRDYATLASYVNSPIWSSQLSRLTVSNVTYN